MAVEDWRPKGSERLATEINDAPPPGTRFVVECSGVAYAFAEGTWSTFGRDDDECPIVVWECLRDQELSRVAGVLWCVDGDLWVRNLSTTHELLVHGGAVPQHLPPRRPGHRGPGCTVAADAAAVSAPSTGPWRLTVSKAAQPDTEERVFEESGSTVTLSRPPPSLLPTAAAMCEPLIRHGGRPATYVEIAQATSSKPRTARDRVERLLDFYRAQGCHRLWLRLENEESHYAPLARLLVYRGIVTSADLDELTDTASGTVSSGA